MSKDPSEEYKYKEKLELKDLKPEFPEVQKICCPTCENPIPADNLNIHTNIAKCNSCDVIFSFSEQAEILSTQQNISQEILQPEGVEISRFREELDIAVQQPWGTFEVILVSFFPLLIVIITSIIIERFAPTDMARAGVITLWLTSFISYIAYFFLRKRHKIYVRIDDEYLHIERRPQKLVKDKHYAIQDIDQVYIKNISSGRETKGVGIYMIVNGNQGQKHVELIRSVNSRSKAKYIEQEIERHLNIPDRRVPDETT